MKRNAAIILAVCAAGLLTACSEGKMKIKGEIEGGADKALMLEKSDYSGRWIPVDSTRVGSDGKFSISSPAPASPEIYRLVLDGRYIYFPVDSTETVTLATSLAGFGNDYTLGGSEQAEKMAAFDRELQRVPLSIADSANAFKRRVYTKYIQDGRGSVLSYYVLTKTTADGKRLYDESNPGDAPYFAAVATQFKEFRPGDPHGKLLEDISMQAMRNRNRAAGRRTVISANELKVLDIALPDENNKTVRLSDKVGKGHPVLVVFSLMNADGALGFCRDLESFRNSHPGVEIYNVSFDTDQYAWCESARNLPWTTVIDAGGHSSTALSDYNVTDLPTIFIYDSAGELADRAADMDQLRKLWTGKKY